jgi:hypothetical protein
VALEGFDLLVPRESDRKAISVRLFMRFQFRAAVILPIFIGFVANALAQDQKQGPTEGRRQVLTGKERLGPKWTDEQRIDNCHVPIDKRGNKPRSSACRDAPSS